MIGGSGPAVSKKCANRKENTVMDENTPNVPGFAQKTMWGCTLYFFWFSDEVKKIRSDLNEYERYSKYCCVLGVCA